MHRATAFDDGAHKRELRRVTTLDIERAAAPSREQEKVESGRV